MRHPADTLIFWGHPADTLIFMGHPVETLITLVVIIDYPSSSLSPSK